MTSPSKEPLSTTVAAGCLKNRRGRPTLYSKLRDRDWLESKIKERKTLAEIAKEAKCSTTAVYNALRAISSPTPTQGPEVCVTQSTAGKITTSLEDGKIIEYHGIKVEDLVREYQTTRVTLDALGKRLGICRERVRQILLTHSARRLTIDDLLDQGITTGDIHDKYGYSMFTIDKYCRDRSMVVHQPMHPELADKQWLERQYIENGLSKEIIGRNIGASPSCVAKWMKRHGIPTRNPLGRKKYRLQTFYPILQDPTWVKSQLDAGKTVWQIAADLGCSRLTVYRAIQELKKRGFLDGNDRPQPDTLTSDAG